MSAWRIFAVALWHAFFASAVAVVDILLVRAHIQICMFSQAALSDRNSSGASLPGPVQTHYSQQRGCARRRVSHAAWA